MKQSLIVGVDVSKSTLDMFFKPSDHWLKVDNNVRGYKQWFKALKQQLSEDCEVLVVMEHTGYYSRQFELFLRKHCLGYCKIPALQIKRSVGVIRGKDDKIDASRIAAYAWMRRELLSADKYPGEKMERLAAIISMRSYLVKQRSGHICRLKEIKAGLKYTNADSLVRITLNLINQLSKDIRVLEKEIKELIYSNEALKKTYKLLISIKGVGLIVAAYMIHCTQNFYRFANARKFNSYAGLAPFKHQSGSSIKTKARVSHFANKDAKALLNLAAGCAVQHDSEMKTYYSKRVAEGKEKMSCMNIIRAKIVARMFAVVKRQTPFVPLAKAA
jgi:transposase